MCRTVWLRFGVAAVLHHAGRRRHADMLRTIVSCLHRCAPIAHRNITLNPHRLLPYAGMLKRSCNLRGSTQCSVVAASASDGSDLAPVPAPCLWANASLAGLAGLAGPFVNKFFDTVLAAFIHLPGYN